MSALLSSSSIPNQQWAVFGLETSVHSAARTIGPIASTDLAIGLGLGSAYLAKSLAFLFLMLMAKLILGVRPPAARSPQD